MYAGILGSLALASVLLRAVGKQAGVEATLWTATLAMFGFAAIGYTLGELAAWIVEDSVRTKVAEEVASAEALKGAPARNQ